MKAPLLISFLVLSTLILPTRALAQWQLDGVGMSSAASEQVFPRSASDGAGGAIVTWQDNRNGAYDIYAQRVDAVGDIQWALDGVALCTQAFGQANARITSDGAGGAIVVWEDFRSGTNNDIYAQRIDASGAVQWTVDGVVLCAAAGNQLSPVIVSDGAGGAVVTWADSRNGGSNYDIYAQRINALGAVQWTVDGVAVCAAAANQLSPVIATDGAGGAIVAWDDSRNGNNDIYAQRIDALGAAQWTANGVALCAEASTQFTPACVTDGAGGAIVTWSDSRGGPSDIYAQRVNPAGAAQWQPDGVAVCAAVGNQINSACVSDGLGGAIVTWLDNRSGDNDIYAQRITASGALQWIASGTSLCTVAGEQYNPTPVSDGAGGAIVAWQDNRGAVGYDIYVQRVNLAGAIQWTVNGVALCTAADTQLYPAPVSGDSGGAIVVWSDYRSGNNDIYAQRVEGTYGYWGHPEPIVTSVADIPNDQGGKVAVNWVASGRDRPVPATIDFYSVWRAVDVAASSAVSSNAASTTPLDRIAIDAAPGVQTMLPGSPYYWELVGTQTAYRFPYYSFSAATRADSLMGDPGDEFFMVAAHDNGDEHIAFASNVASGHSVDNLAPAAPLFLTAQRVGPDVNLKWNRVTVTDLKNYAVYRATSSGVTPVPLNFLGDSIDSTLVDTGAPVTSLYYIVTAKDVHLNQSPPSNEASVSPVTGVGDTPALTQLTVLANYPNPFGVRTELQVGLPAPSDINVEIYDVAGRRVSTLTVKQAGAGWQKIPFAAQDSRGNALASGVYFYRVHANGTTVTRKMVITR